MEISQICWFDFLEVDLDFIRASKYDKLYENIFDWLAHDMERKEVKEETVVRGELPQSLVFWATETAKMLRRKSLIPEHVAMIIHWRADESASIKFVAEGFWKFYTKEFLDRFTPSYRCRLVTYEFREPTEEFSEKQFGKFWNKIGRMTLEDGIMKEMLRDFVRPLFRYDSRCTQLVSCFGTLWMDDYGWKRMTKKSLSKEKRGQIEGELIDARKWEDQEYMRHFYAHYD
jgi:hypothetical protein